MILAAALQAGAGLWASNEAGDKSAKGSQAALREQQRQYDASLRMLEPTRALGYGAQSDLASLYGYRLPGYTPADQLTSGAGSTPNLGRHATVGAPGSASSPAFNSLITVKGRQAAGGSPTDPKTYFGGADRRLGGTIDPITGTVNLRNVKNPKKEARIEERATAYLRGETDRLKGKRLRRIRHTIDAMRDQGYTYDPNAVNVELEPTAGPIASQQYFDPLDPNSDPRLPARPAGTSADGTAGNFGRFFTSPDYLFRQQEGARAIDRSAAARGGALSGNAVRAQTGYASDLAAGEYGNYVNRLLSMAGLGQTATNTAVTTGANYANNAGQLMQNAADARASGVMGGANSVTNAINSGLNTWLWSDYLRRQR